MAPARFGEPSSATVELHPQCPELVPERFHQLDEKSVLPARHDEHQFGHPRHARSAVDDWYRPRR